MPAFPVSGKQIARFSKRAAHLIFPIVRKGSLKREKSQSKIDQDFRRNRKTSEMGVIVIIKLEDLDKKISYLHPKEGTNRDSSIQRN
ncbi:hypothetical protein DW083_05170 [Parabacteroides sp. AF48-14]|nr:hypothetical protein DW083_05170 [Parabacteroides sp. AF48-14]